MSSDKMMETGLGDPVDEALNNIIVCVRADRDVLIPHTTVSCYTCGIHCYISMASLLLAQEKNAKPICLECFQEQHDGERVTIQPMTEAQQKEYKESMT